MSEENTPFVPTDESAFIVVRAFSDLMEAQHASVNVTSRALLVELAEQSLELNEEFHMLASADVQCDRFFEYPCVAQVIKKSGYTANIFVQILRDLNALDLTISAEELAQNSAITDRALSFSAFDIIELNTAHAADSRYIAPQWAVRLGQWATWFLTAEARFVIGRIARAALSQTDLESYRITLKLGEYIHFTLHAEEQANETRIPLLNLLAEVTDISVLEMRDRKHEEQLAELVKKFNSAAAALRSQGVCSIRLLRTGVRDQEHAAAHNDNFQLLSQSYVTISAAG
jgi:hypothetical protein